MVETDDDRRDLIVVEHENLRPANHATKWIKIIGILVNLLIAISAIFLTLIEKGGTSMVLCRVYATIGAIFMWISFIRMIIIFSGRRNKAVAEKSMPVTMAFFVLFMTLVALYGYYSKCTKLRIFWEYDFILHYSYQVVELTMDIIYIFSIVPYLFVLPLYLLFVARVYVISPLDNWLFCTTLFLNALQKWVFESIVVHMELCEELNHKETFNYSCEKYIKYSTSRNDLNNTQKELYFSIQGNEAFTYTITMELFIACIGLIVFFAQRELHHRSLNMNERVGPQNLCSKVLASLGFFILLLSPLYLIYVIPVISVTNANKTLRTFQIGSRLIVHFSNFALIFYTSCYLFHLNLKPPTDLPSEADIMILWVAWATSTLKVLLKAIIQLIWFTSFSDGHELILSLVAIISNLFETGAFYFLIFLVEHFLLIAENTSSILPKPSPSASRLPEIPSLSNELSHESVAAPVFTPPVEHNAPEVASTSQVTKEETQSSVEHSSNVSPGTVNYHHESVVMKVGAAAEPRLTKFVLTFLPLYFCVSLFGFVAYYITNTFHVLPQNPNSTAVLHVFVLLHSSYPTTMLFTMTLCICFASVMEKLYQKGYYRF